MKPYIAQTIADVEARRDQLTGLIDQLRALSQLGDVNAPVDLTFSVQVTDSVPTVVKSAKTRTVRTAKPKSKHRALPAPASKSPPTDDAGQTIDSPRETAVAEGDAQAGPCSDGGIRIGKTLSATFTPTDLLARIDNPKSGGNWIFRWQTLGWIEQAGFGQWRKTATFGVR